jgi:hypothetical protein
MPRLALRRSRCSQTAMQLVESSANDSSAPLGGRSTAGSTSTGEDVDATDVEPPAKRVKPLKANKRRYMYKDDHARTYGERI